MKKYHNWLIGASILIATLLLFVNTSKAEIPQQKDCSSEIAPYLNQYEQCNISLNESINETSYYKNLSEFYKNIYESKEINVTNREIILLNQQINNMNMTINDIKNELSFLKLTLKISIPILSVTVFSLWGFSFYLRKKMKEENEE